MKVLNKIEADFNDIVANESDIVKDLRIENFSEFKKLGIPTSKEEFWKFTNPSVTVSYTHLTLPTKRIV